MRKRKKRLAVRFQPTPFMQEAEAFVNREPVGSSLPASCVQMLLDAIDCFEEFPEYHDRTFHAFMGAKGYFSFSLLGYVAAAEGLDLASIPHNEQAIPVREYLSRLGFTYYDQLCLKEINSHSKSVDVLRERTLRFASTGERMPFLDEFVEDV